MSKPSTIVITIRPESAEEQRELLERARQAFPLAPIVNEMTIDGTVDAGFAEKLREALANEALDRATVPRVPVEDRVSSLESKVDANRDNAVALSAIDVEAEHGEIQAIPTLANDDQEFHWRRHVEDALVAGLSTDGALERADAILRATQTRRPRKS